MSARRWIFAASAGLGVLVGGAWLRPWSALRSAMPTERIEDVRGQDPGSRSSSPVAAFRRLLRDQSPSMDEGISMKIAAQQLADEKRSPLRTRAFLRSKIAFMDHDQLVMEMMDGDIDTLPEIREAARRLTQEDPQGTFTAFEKGLFRLNTMEKLYAFLDTLLQTWTDQDAPAVMNRLKGMKRGGAQQDASLRFSDYWARTKPDEAAESFSDLIYLRNMDDFGHMDFNEVEYARKIVESWSQRDLAALVTFVDRLPRGRVKLAFDEAMASTPRPE
ncbi:hypothetical protein HNR46_000178 [Haloferula luteola]|uniref:Uncharacterized protein n=1 Tax=Haloferula luteola TaxID=595692 RepID=A0A840UUT0_9BACT|nr:hypothetical protein [Haloferula luteola]MBB5349957.1 hypothetical protein [Haloferula luteola]